LGPNGAGKTTLIKSMCGLLQPTTGTISIAGYETDKQRQQVWSQIGYMSQRFSLYRDLTVLENLNLYAGLYNVENVNFDQILQMLGLADQSHHLSGNLPIGIRQRLSLVCAILHEPPVIFLDEPTSGVDPVARRDFWNIIHQLTRKMGKTVLVSTHYMDEAERCDRLILMDQGKLVALDSPESLKLEATQKFGGMIVITTEESKRAYSLIKNAFPKATLFGQDVHLRSMDVERDIELLLRELDSAKLAKLSVASAPISMGEAFMDWINHVAVDHV
jgi:ABC-2 type transport system ATP-binding protein